MQSFVDQKAQFIGLQKLGLLRQSKKNRTKENMCLEKIVSDLIPRSSNLQHGHTLGNSFVLHFVEYKTAHIEQANRRVGGEWFLHIGINYTVGIIDLGNS